MRYVRTKQNTWVVDTTNACACLEANTLPLLINVTGFIGVRIHRKNSSKDTQDCILCGKKRQCLEEKYAGQSPNDKTGGLVILPNTNKRL